jgi:hypothetical protein
MAMGRGARWDLNVMYVSWFLCPAKGFVVVVAGLSITRGMRVPICMFLATITKREDAAWMLWVSHSTQENLYKGSGVVSTSFQISQVV